MIFHQILCLIYQEIFLKFFALPIVGPNGLIFFIVWFDIVKRQLNQDYDNNLNPILIATNITNKDVIMARVLPDKNFIFKKFPICPPINTAIKSRPKI